MLQFKRLHQCTWDEAVQAYNRGFEGYFFDQSKTADSLALKIGKEELSVAHSIVAFIDGEPAGIVLSGIWQRNGKKIAWNGGTGVAPAYRRQGVGQALMEETLKIYREQGVEQAALVAIRENHKAISLYEKMGFHVVDQSLFLENHRSLSSFVDASILSYDKEHGIPQDVYQLAFWDNPVWDIQWQTVENREALLVQDECKRVIGYALYRRIFDESGKHATTLLFHCAADPGRDDADAIIRFALAHIFIPHEAEIHRVTVNLPSTNSRVVTVLEEAGFTTFAEQVFMIKEIK